MSKLHCVPHSPEVMSQLYADYVRIAQGEGLTFEQYLVSIGYTNPAEHNDGMDDAAMMRRRRSGGPDLELISLPEKPIHGQLRVKVLLIDFPDREGTLPVSHYNQLLFSKDTYPTGSMRDYFREVTLGKVDVTGSIHGWLRMPNDYSYYTNGESGTEYRSYPRNARRMAEDAVNAALDAGINFGDDLDVLDDGTITALFIIHAGLGAETLSPSIRGNHIWSHKWATQRSIEVSQNLYASTYLTVPHNCKVGVCAHELGHLAFQWEDFYDPNYGEDGKEWDGSGSWDVMASGSYNGNGNRPCHPAALHKTQHNWIEVTPVTSSGQHTLKPYTPTSGQVLKLISPKYRSGQYLLLENRTKTGFDSDLPGEGLLVWKVDESADMFAPDKPALLLVQADGRRQLQTPDDWNKGDAGDPFPGSSNRTNLSDTGIISTSFPDGEDSGISLKNIQRDIDNGHISLDIEFEGDTTVTSDLIEFTANPAKQIPDNNDAGIESVIDVNQDGIVRQIAVKVDISHTYIGDLLVELVAPTGQTVTLHKQEGRHEDDLKKTYSVSSHPALSEMIGLKASGSWTLRVSDHANADIGVLNSWTLAIELDKAESVVRMETKPELQIPDNDPSGVASVMHIARSGVAHNIKVHVDIDHTYIGDLRVELINPQGNRALLHNKTGAHQDDLKITYESSSKATLASLVGQPINGDWTLRISDLMGNDVGKLNMWSLEIELAAHTQKVSKENTNTQEIPDDDPSGVGSSISFTERGTVQSIEFLADITHTYIGDLRVELIAPSGNRAVLHNKTGGGTDNLQLQLKSAESAELGVLAGEPLHGAWVLRVADLEELDTGTLNQWSLNMTYME